MNDKKTFSEWLIFLSKNKKIETTENIKITVIENTVYKPESLYGEYGVFI